MRTKNELLQLMLDNQHLFETGLCLLAFTMSIKRIISHDECKFMKEYIRNNKPQNAISNFYYLQIGNIEPRIEWIKKQMES